MQIGALLVATGLLIIRISFFLKLDQKWLSYGPKTYAHIWARRDMTYVHMLGAGAKFSLILPTTWANINIFQ